MAKKSGRYWFKNLILFVVAMIVGAVLTVGGVAGAGYLLLTKKTVGDVAGDSFDLSDTVRQLSLLDYGIRAVNAVANAGSSPLGELEDALGYSITGKLNDMLGTPVEALRASTLGTLSDTLVDNMTLITVRDKFGVAFPELPLFEDEAFLATPITEAFGNMDDYTLDNFIVIHYGDPEEDPEADTLLMQRLGQEKLSEVSQNMQGIIDDCALSEVIKINEGDFLAHFADIKIGEMGEKMDARVQELTLEDVMTIDETSAPALRALRTCQIQNLSDQMQALPLREMVEPGKAHIWSYLADKTLDELGGAIDDMKLGDAIQIGKVDEDGNPLDADGHVLVQREFEGTTQWGYLDEGGAFVPSEQDRGSSHIILWKLRETPVNEMGSAMDGAIKTTTIGELLGGEPKDSDPMLLKTLWDTHLDSEEISDKMDSVTITELYHDAHAGILGMIPGDTRLDELPTALAAAMENAVLYRMDALNVVNVNLSTASGEVKSKMYNATVSDLLGHYLDLMNADASDPTGLAAKLANLNATRKYRLDGDTLTQEVLDGISGFGRGDTLVLTQDTTIPAGTRFDYPFNVIAAHDDTITVQNGDPVSTGSVQLTIEENVTVGPAADATPDPSKYSGVDDPAYKEAVKQMELSRYGYLYVQADAGKVTGRENITSTNRIETDEAREGAGPTYVDGIRVEWLQKDGKTALTA